MIYGLTFENQQYIKEKSKSKKNGVYEARGVAYIVKDGYPTHYLTNDGRVFSDNGNFNVSLGSIEIDLFTKKRDFIKIAKENKWI